ncbi:MAG: DUF2383 domain-containing protein [Gemmatimonadota bacterium]|nr:DUF2383 domain-containing protein [Gemmatimonadota bacterium]
MLINEDPTYEERTGLVVETMSRLARVCIMASRAYRVAAEHAEDEDVAEALSVLAEDRAMMADELRSGWQGFAADASTDMVEVQETVEPIEKALDDGGTGSLLMACEEAETAIADAYHRALEQEGLPPDARERLEQHLEILEEGREELIELSHARVG